MVLVLVVPVLSESQNLTSILEDDDQLWVFWGVLGCHLTSPPPLSAADRDNTGRIWSIFEDFKYCEFGYPQATFGLEQRKIIYKVLTYSPVHVYIHVYMWKGGPFVMRL